MPASAVRELRLVVGCCAPSRLLRDQGLGARPSASQAVLTPSAIRPYVAKAQVRGTFLCRLVSPRDPRCRPVRSRQGHAGSRSWPRPSGRSGDKSPQGRSPGDGAISHGSLVLLVAPVVLWPFDRRPQEGRESACAATPSPVRSFRSSESAGWRTPTPAGAVPAGVGPCCAGALTWANASPVVRPVPSRAGSCRHVRDQLVTRATWRGPAVIGVGRVSRQDRLS